MLALRLQRLGRKGHPTYRLAVQEAQRHPSSGRVVAYVGSYDPHAKTTTLNREKVEFYLNNGAQPSPRVVRILQSEKIALPAWVSGASTDKASAIRHPEKLRKNQPKEEAETPVDAPSESVTEEAAAPEATAATDETK